MCNPGPQDRDIVEAIRRVQEKKLNKVIAQVIEALNDPYCNVSDAKPSEKP